MLPTQSSEAVDTFVYGYSLITTEATRMQARANMK